MKKSAWWQKRLAFDPETWVFGKGRLDRLQVDADILFAALATWPLPAGVRMLVVTENLSLAETLAADLRTFGKLLGKGAEPVVLPELETTRRHLLPENEAERARILDMARQPGGVFLASAIAATSATPPPKRFQEHHHELHRGDTDWPPEKLAAYLVELDYDNEAQVHVPGEFSLRGGILDLFSPAHEFPVRLEYFGNEIESLRFFDPETQRTVESVEECVLLPRGETGLMDDDPDCCFLDYCPAEQLLVVVCDPPEVERHLRSYATPAQLANWRRFTHGDHAQLWAAAQLAELGQGDAPAYLYPGFALTSQLAGLFPEIELTWESVHQQALATQLEQWQETGYAFLVCTSSRSKEERFQGFLEERGLADLKAEYVQAPLSCGMLLPAEQLVVLTDSEIFGKAPARPPRFRHSAYRADHALHDGTELHDGDFAVHAGYGICRYRGIRMETFHDRQQEVIVLEFANEVKLFVPLPQAYLVSRYVGSGRKLPKLSKLGGGQWKQVKANAEASIDDLAAELLQVQAMRESSEGFAFVQEGEAMRAFEDAFPYTETDDQARAIDEVKVDMEEPRPMDRLVCGDVGFGKTEVAMRAAFKAVLSGKQVAILVPTTVLSQQHFLTFSERFREYPVIIENLSRFLTPYRQREILDALKEGRIDIVVGTHRLLSFDVHFRDLGLLIIDEEQRFGVKHKERLKRLRADVDILTLTATPIPRTLYLSLAGLRDLSTIVTAPRERLPVQTVVAQYDDTLIEQAIRRELQRHGQVFYLYNRVQTIHKAADRLRKLVPEARIDIGHGQMGENQLEDAMLRFIEGETDVLCCTTIIESGVDIPNANTMIIERADRFGLADLYQLRGRVGRYHRQAYAYLLVPKQGVMAGNAHQRLAAIRKYTQLGAGFKLALRDLEIRGAGNLLGAQQSGHIAAIGFDLYCQLLKESVAKLKNQPLPSRPTTQVDLDFVVYGPSTQPGVLPAYLPTSYLQEETTRLEIYRRISEVPAEDALKALEAEIRDRFGPPPPEVQHVLLLTRARLHAYAAGIHSVTVRDRRVMLETTSGHLKDAAKRLPRLSSDDPADRLKELYSLIALVPRR